MTWLSRVTPDDEAKADKVMAGWLAAKALPPVGAMVLWQDPPDEPYLQRYSGHGGSATIRDCVIGDWLTGILVGPTDPGTPIYTGLLAEQSRSFVMSRINWWYQRTPVSILRKAPVA